MRKQYAKSNPKMGGGETYKASNELDTMHAIGISCRIRSEEQKRKPYKNTKRSESACSTRSLRKTLVAAFLVQNWVANLQRPGILARLNLNLLGAVNLSNAS
jgi:hypothetical protein